MENIVKRLLSCKLHEFRESLLIPFENSLKRDCHMRAFEYKFEWQSYKFQWKSERISWKAEADFNNNYILEIDQKE